MPGHAIQVLTFDADGTIWDFQTTTKAAFAASLAELQAQFPEPAAHLSVDDLLTHRQEAEAAFRGQSMTIEELRFAGFMRTLDAIGVRDEPLANKLAREYLERRFANARIFDDVIPTLEFLKAHFRLGLLTNGNSYPDNLGLHDQFEFTLVAHDYDLWKADLAFYEKAVEEAGVPANQVLHIGDSLENDVRPARRAGMQVVWLNRKGEDAPALQQSVATLYSLQELPAFLGMTSG
jgi:FMN hydrolase / 5-amino-6-(5-phospho-D-ribitylamino)uracil phosphatase